MSKKKKKEKNNEVSKPSVENAWNYNEFYDYEKSENEIPEGNTCKCGGSLWFIDDYIVCGHCGKKWFPGTDADDE